MQESIYSHQYENGLTLVGEPIAGRESAAITLMTPSGCRYDPLQRQGLAGMTCDMMLRGAGDRDSRKFLFDMECLGLERSEGVTNGHTTYSAATLASNMPAALELYADLLRRPHLPADELEASRLVVLQELASVEDDPSQKVMQHLRLHHYPDPLGRNSHGLQEDIESITHDDVGQYFAANYYPSGTILGVAGQFDWDALCDQVGMLFGDWQPAKPPPLRLAEADDKTVHIDHDSQQTQIGIAYNSIPFKHPDFYQAFASVSVLSGGMSARLFTEVREKRGLCYSVYATLHTLEDRGSVLCYAGTSAERAQETLDVTLGELQRLSDGVEPNELDRLKARIKSGLIMQHESSSARSGAIVRDWYHLGRARTLDEIGQKVDALSCDSINAYLAEHPAGDFTIVTLGPRPLEVSLGVS